MTSSGAESVAVVASSAGMPAAANLSRPQVGIERLPTRRAGNEPRESMNCKSCRKRKIKCNRLRPACEACQVFQCPCIYDAVPKKRGPKTDVLEALLKRVDGLEQRLKDTEKPDAPSATKTFQLAGGDEAEATEVSDEPLLTPNASGSESKGQNKSAGASNALEVGEPPTISPPNSAPSPQGVAPEVLLDTYFSRVHAKPYHILDESSVRQRLQLNQVPDYLLHAIYAIGARYTHNVNGYQLAIKLSEDYAARARGEIDIDEPSIDALQALLLLVTAFTASGKGRKAYMLLTNAVGMTVALELHREVDGQARITAVEREMRRRLFWTCYLLDRFMACGSKRPSLLGDKSILLRLPCWSPNPASLPIEGEFFQNGSNLQYLQGSGKKSQGSSGMLIDITRILGITNRYLAAGGVKGDSHFPWHSLSNLSKIRQGLDVWASGTEDVFSSLDKLFGQPDSTVLVLSKLIYHLIHCLIYRPFLPIDLAELAGTGQHQSWQIEATNMCFLHANAIAELVELGKRTATIEWPAFVGYCICTAGTVHIHGTHYNKGGQPAEMSVFSSSVEFLSREMQQLNELRYAWASVQHQRDTLQGIYNAHFELVKSLSNNPMRYSPVFQLEDFFDRYSNIGGLGGQTFNFDAANISLSDPMVELPTDVFTGHDLFAPRVKPNLEPNSSERPSLKRKKTSASSSRRQDAKNAASMSTNKLSVSQTTQNLAASSSSLQTSFATTGFHHPSSAGLLSAPTSNPGIRNQEASSSGAHGLMTENLANAVPVGPASTAGFSYQHRPNSNQMSGLSNTSFSPTFNFGTLPSSGSTGGPSDLGPGHGHTSPSGYDPMFGTIPTNAFGSPAAWNGEDGNGITGLSNATVNTHNSPGVKSHTGSSGTGPGEEKDPFLSLLEHLAENEFAHGSGSELDFFLAGVPNPE